MLASRLALAGLLALWCGNLIAAPAESAAPPAQGDDLDDVVVVATSRATTVANTPYSVALIDPEFTRLRLQAPSLADALAETPGTMLQKTAPGMTSPYLRGFTGQRVVLVADGVRTNTGYLREGPNQYWSLVDGYFYDQLEVLMGPAGVLYGSDAIGGVVLASPTPLARGEADHGLQWQGGIADLRLSSAERSISEHVQGDFALDDDWSFRLGVTRQDFGELRSGDSTDNHQTDYEQWGTNLRARHYFSEDESLYFGVDWFDQDDVERVHQTIYHEDFHGTGSKGGTSDLGRTYDQARGAAFARYEERHQESWYEELDLGISYQYLEEQYRRLRSNGTREHRSVQLETVGLNLRLQSPSEWGTWTYGVDFTHDQTNTAGNNISAANVVTPRIQGLIADDATYDLLGVYVQHELPLGEQLSLLTGLRYTYAMLEARDVNMGGSEGSLSGHYDALTGSARLLARVLPDERLHLFTGVSQGFRAPNLADTTYDGEFGGGTELPTADLDPETFTTFEAGAKSRGGWGEAQVVAYHTIFQDKIVRLQTPVPTKRNGDDGYLQGIEAQGRLQLAPAWAVLSSLAWQEGAEDTWYGRDLTRPGDNRPLSRVQPLSGRVALRCAPPQARWWGEAGIDFADQQDKLSADDQADNRFPPDGTPGYAVYGVRAGYQLSPRADLSVGLENLGDKAYRIHGSGLNEPGRNLIVALRVRF